MIRYYYGLAIPFFMLPLSYQPLFIGLTDCPTFPRSLILNLDAYVLIINFSILHNHGMAGLIT